jgi:tetratricopeptide (TPR) repeat protein
MSNSCYNSINTGDASNKAGNYNDALNTFNQVLQKCDAYDAKEKGYAGKAAALNGLKQYNDALDASNKGLEINKTSIDNLFQRANAELGLNQKTDAKNDFATIIDLTKKNKNVKDVATIYAKMADIDLKQQMYSDALTNVDSAISIDPTNTAFYMLRGDINTRQNAFDDALKDYDKAIAAGKDDAVVWQAKMATSIKSYQAKYNTSDINQLGKKMSSADKNTLCSNIQKATAKGVKDVNIDLLQVTICK